MNWRTVGIIRRGRRNGESGQAFTELAVSLVVIILPAFIGFLIVAVLCANGVSDAIRAREDADDVSSRGGTSREGRSIVTWLDGQDGIPFTADDVPFEGTVTSHDYDRFTRELAYASERPEYNPKVSVAHTNPVMPHASEFWQFDRNHFFVRAANLVQGTPPGSVDPFQKYGISELEHLIQDLFRVENFEIQEEEAYMPAHIGI